MKIIRNEYYITDDPNKANLDVVEQFLSKTYWASSRPKETIKKSIQNSVCFSMYKDSVQIGFARIVTDYTTVAYLADVIIDPLYRRQGLGKWFIKTIVNDERWRDLLNLLVTKDAHNLYKHFGFNKSEKLMLKNTKEPK